ncbi:hypothetical protein [Mycolicibacterium palauense]|uniref:hypothetical protein n=1 Tax=Mycolicibacterium palauense TaxID=2034511 RepID=UPI001FE34EA7|nr:hypothetical protein [Mycolicibacterium palauense]
MPYPTDPADGDQVGANLVSTPSFPTLDKGLWSSGSVDVRDIGGGVMANRLAGFTITTIALPDVPVEAASFTISALLITVNSQCYMGVRPIGSSELVTNVVSGGIWQWVTITDSIGAGESGSGVELYLRTPTAGQMGLVSVRVDYDDSPVADYFDGTTADTADYAFAWDGAAFASASSALAIVAGGGGGDPDPEPQPEPEPGALPGVAEAAQKVAAFLGQADNPQVLLLAAEVTPVITAMVRAYVRDRGFTGAVPNAELSSVIITASARLMANPEQLDTTVGATGIRGAFAGWTLAEQAVLNRYRKRAA